MSMLHFFVVKLKQHGTTRSTELCLRFKTPDSSEDFASEILSAFCFPLGPESVAPKEYMASEEYTFALNRDGKRFQGFCRKGLPPAPKVGSKLRLPQVICVISEYPWCNFYFKVLQAVEQLLRCGDTTLEGDPKELPPNSGVGIFLSDLARQLSMEPSPGDIIRVPFPKGEIGLFSISPPSLKGLLRASSINESNWGEDQVELQVPPDCGNGKWNCGISLARLLWHVPVSAMLTLISAILLERRIIIAGQSRDTVTAAVQAAAALLYPFRWHHIYLPLLPKQLQDYLSAPMPFMVGLPAQMLPILKRLAVDEVTIVDLDLGTCEPAPNSVRDDSVHLPWKEQLEAALTAAYANLKSPTEVESSPFIAGIMQEYFLKLLGHYRRFIHPDTPAQNALYAGSRSSSSRSTSSPRPAASPSTNSSSLSRPSSRREEQDDSALKGYGYVFEHDAFVAYHRRNEKARRFLSMLRHSQLYEMFIQERLKLASQDYKTDSAFEAHLVRYHERQRNLSSARSALRKEQQREQPSQSKWSAMLKRHRRTGSGDPAIAGGWGKDISMRRITTEPDFSHSQGGATGVDPASFFQDDDGDDFIEEAAAEQLPLPGIAKMHSHEAARRELQVHSVTVPPRQAATASAGSDWTRATSEISLSRYTTGSVSVVAPDSPVGTSAAAGQKKAAGGIVLSFQAGAKHYEGNFTSIVKEMWSTVGRKVGVSANGAPPPPAGPESCLPDEDSASGTIHDAGEASTSGNVSEPVPGVRGSSGMQYKRHGSVGEGMVRAAAGLVQRYTPQAVHQHLPSLLDGGGVKLKQPPAPTRPLQPDKLASPEHGHQAQDTGKMEGVHRKQVSASESGVAPPAVSASGSAPWDPFGLGFRQA